MRWWRRWRFLHSKPLPTGAQGRVTAGFVVTFLGAIAFVWVYAVDGGTQLLGLSLGAALLGAAYAFAAWASLLPQGPYVEEREQMQPPPDERRPLSDDLTDVDRAIVSASIPRRAMTLGLSALAVAVIVPLRSLFTRGTSPAVALATTAWRPGRRVVRKDGTPVRASDLEVGTALTVYPEGHIEDGDASVLLMRVDPADLRLSAERQGWTVEGIVGYSKICTHAGCPVGLFAEGSGQLLCPCHQSVFDVLQGAKPLYGPASRALPQLPLTTSSDGELVALGGFPEPIGPSYWRRA
ncbi:MAG TPA: Rieske (2Fe-2S) protein [Angustibacter sp.]|nr:Rieske (2Fe-2S) protein [Angustibacter sp.]